MKKLKTAVIGLGRIGWEVHLPGCAANPGFEVCAAVDPLEERLVEAEKKFRIKGYKDCLSMYKEQALDLVIIASPTGFHKEQALEAFKNGADVLCDKPVASSLSDTDEMIAEMKKLNRKLMVFHCRRAHNYFTAMQEIIKKGILGPVYMIKGSNNTYCRRNDWQAFKKNGGGMIMNHGPHFVDQLLLLSEYKAKKISCSKKAVATLGDAEDVVQFLIETSSGTILQIDLNMASTFPKKQFEIFGKYGQAILDGLKKTITVKYLPKENMPVLKPQQGFAASGRSYNPEAELPFETLQYSYNDFPEVNFFDKCYEYFALNKPSFVPIEQTRELMRILEECRNY